MLLGLLKNVDCKCSVWAYSTREVEGCQFGRWDVCHEALHPQVNKGTAPAQQLFHLRQAGYTFGEGLAAQTLSSVLQCNNQSWFSVSSVQGPNKAKTCHIGLHCFGLLKGSYLGFCLLPTKPSHRWVKCWLCLSKISFILMLRLVPSVPHRQ